MIYNIIDSYSIDGKGLPIGNQTSQAFAIRYLDEMDRVIKEKYRVKYYIRYMDDFILISKSKEYLKTILNNLEILLKEKYKLEFNKKTRIYRLDESVEFLGFRYRLLDNGKINMHIDGKRRKRFEKNIYLRNKLLNEGKISIESYNSTIESYKSHISKGNNYKYKSRILFNNIL